MIPQQTRHAIWQARLRGARLGYLRWQNKHISPGVLLIIIAMVMGMLTGAAAAMLKRLISIFDSLFLTNLHTDTPNFKLLIWPLAGILITSIFQRYVVQGNVARGTRIIKQNLEQKRFSLNPLNIFNPLLGCSVTIGFGSSGGSEGPTALSGAVIGSNVGRWFGVSDKWLGLLVAIGGGAGIAAIFKSPMGGVLFALEVLQIQMTTIAVIALVFACLISSATAYLLSNFTFDIRFSQMMEFDTHNIGWICLLGVFCGLYCIYYNYTKKKSTKYFSSIRNPWFAALITGGIMSVSVFAFPTLYGEGFRVITGLINGNAVSFAEGGILAGHTEGFWVLGSLAIVLLLKSVLVAASYSGGGVAGDFVPTFFAGALAGYLFAVIVNSLFDTQLPAWFFALAGMGCVMGGTVHAPLMALFILCETTNTYAYLFPYLLAIGLCYATVKIITPKSWYGETKHDDLMALMNISNNRDLNTRGENED
ncbi:MAG: chloride channel protein [Muribaculaceae bacterium]|nr:chloride channel protein [Muribaculaceae bacterium]